MYLTNGQRFRKLFFNLAINPKHLIRYSKYSLSKKSPLELGLPWWSYKGIDLLYQTYLEIKWLLNGVRVVYYFSF